MPMRTRYSECLIHPQLAHGQDDEVSSCFFSKWRRAALRVFGTPFPDCFAGQCIALYHRQRIALSLATQPWLVAFLWLSVDPCLAAKGTVELKW